MKKQVEASTVPTSLKGFQAPVSSKKGKSNPSSPFGDEELFENMVANALMNDEEVEEVVRKRGSNWVIHDDETDASLGSYDSRSAAWERQRIIRKKKKAEDEFERRARERKKKIAAHPPKKAPKLKKESALHHLRDMMKIMLRESVLQYVFEQPQGSEEAVAWDRFVGALSRESLMSDKKLKDILINLQKSELKMLNIAMKAVQGALGSKFEISDVKQSQDQNTGKPVLTFNVTLDDNQKVLPFALKIENARPLIHLPDQTRAELNMLANDESKLLRAELIHVQENQLDMLDDVIKASEKRDTYLSGLEGKLDKVVHNLGPLEISMLRNLLKVKYRGVK